MPTSSNRQGVSSLFLGEQDHALPLQRHSQSQRPACSLAALWRASHSPAPILTVGMGDGGPPCSLSLVVTSSPLHFSVCCRDREILPFLPRPLLFLPSSPHLALLHLSSTSRPLYLCGSPFISCTYASAYALFDDSWLGHDTIHSFRFEVLFKHSFRRRDLVATTT